MSWVAGGECGSNLSSGAYKSERKEPLFGDGGWWSDQYEAGKTVVVCELESGYARADFGGDGGRMSNSGLCARGELHEWIEGIISSVETDVRGDGV
jgi:hypothetical protein